MELITSLLDILLHLDRHLGEIIRDFGVWTYLILFVIVFCETGLVVTPILPGDSLLFAVGTFAALGALDLAVALIVLSVAAVAGDSINYAIGYRVGPSVFRGERSRWLNRKYLDRTHQFYERHGSKTIVIARFVPIVRTFAPFVAGIGRMTYSRFLTYNVHRDPAPARQAVVASRRGSNSTAVTPSSVFRSRTSVSSLRSRSMR